jgi:uncharacterized delta-60 repeat protein
MFYFTSLKMRGFFAFALAALFCFSATAANAQSASQNVGAVDPLLDDYRFFRHGNFNPLANTQAKSVFLNQKENVSPTAGELDASLNVSIDSQPGNVRTVVVQPDGKLLVAGFFKAVNNARHKSIVRLNADFSLDATFSASVNGTILAVALQPDGKILVGGTFIVVGGQSRNRIARLNADGSLDTTFNPGTGADNFVYDIAVQPDGKIIVAGNFFSVNSVGNYGVARLNTDGSVDTSFVSPIPFPILLPNPPFQIPSSVYSIVVQPDGKILLGGYIVTSYNGTTPVTKMVVRLTQNGSFDSSFNSGTMNSNALKLALQPDGKILVVGNFTNVSGTNRRFVARLNAEGSLDMTFNPGTGANFPVTSVFLKPDGKILIVGRFSTFNDVARSNLAQLNPDGSLNDTFVPSGGLLLGAPQNVIALPNGKVLASGSFAASVNGGGNDSLRVYNTDGSLDNSVVFSTTALGGVRAIAVQPDGKILVGGNFTRPRSNALTQIFRVNTDGTLDTSFGGSSQTFSTTGGFINSIIVQPDGKILLAGININNGSSTFLGNSIVRLNADGTADTSFVQGNIPLAGGINAMALQPDGKIVVVWGLSQQTGPPSGGVARLNPDGSVDTSFNSNLPGAIWNSVIVQPDGKILLGGPFGFSIINSQTGTVSYNGIVRLNADGSHDAAFVPATQSDYETGRVSQVFALSLQPNGKILVGGRIYVAGSDVPAGVARLNSNGTFDGSFNLSIVYSNTELARVEDIHQLPNGKVLVGGRFDSIGTASQSNVARLQANGSADLAFYANTDATVYDVTTQADGKVLIGGDFEFVNGTPRTSFARLLSEPTANRTKFDFDGDGKADVSAFRPSNGVWYLLNSQSGFTGVSFGQAGDKLAPADYDGDGRTDLAVFRNGTWYLQRSTAGFTGIAFGEGSDIPQPADFDGDGQAELAVYRPANGGWYIYNLTTNQFTSAQFGATEDKPVVSDYDGDGKADYAVFRPSTGTWYLQRSTAGFTGVAFGQAEDRPVAADYDGDGKTDIAVFRPSSGAWYLLRSHFGFMGVSFGIGTDVPVPADYDGDGRADIAVFRDGTWYLQRSQAGFTGIAFGAATDKPIPSTFVQ